MNFLFGLRCLLTPFLGRHATELPNEDQRDNCHSTAASRNEHRKNDAFLAWAVGVEAIITVGIPLPPPPSPRDIRVYAPKPPYYLRKPQTALSVTVCCPQKQTRWVSTQELPKQEKKPQGDKTVKQISRVYQSTCTETAVNVQTTGGEIACRTPSEPIPSSFHPVNLG